MHIRVGSIVRRGLPLLNAGVSWTACVAVAPTEKAHVPWPKLRQLQVTAMPKRSVRAVQALINSSELNVHSRSTSDGVQHSTHRKRSQSPAFFEPVGRTNVHALLAQASDLQHNWVRQPYKLLSTKGHCWYTCSSITKGKWQGMPVDCLTHTCCIKSQQVACGG